MVAQAAAKQPASEPARTRVLQEERSPVRAAFPAAGVQEMPHLPGTQVPAAQRQAAAAQLAQRTGNQAFAATQVPPAASGATAAPAAAAAATAGISQTPEDSAYLIGEILEYTREQSGPAPESGTFTARSGDNVSTVHVSHMPAARSAVLIEALAVHDPAARRDVEQIFGEAFGRSLYTALYEWRHRLAPRDGLVIYALLRGSKSWLEPHVTAALALHVENYEETNPLMRLLYHLSDDGRRQLVADYSATFAHPDFVQFVSVSHGGVTGDLKKDIEACYGFFTSHATWEREKLLALLNHRITEAEELYFETLGRVGTTTQSVVARIRGLWEQGPEKITQLIDDWDAYVRNQSGWTDKAWSDRELLSALDWELSGDEWRTVKTIFEAHEGIERNLSRHTAATDEQLAAIRKDEIRRAQFRVAYDLFDISKGKDEAAVRKMAELTGGGMSESAKADLLREQWLDSMGRGGLEPGEADKARYARYRLVIEGRLRPCDELYFAIKTGDDAQAEKVATGIWLADSVIACSNDATRPVQGIDWKSAYGEEQKMEVLRPAYDFERLVNDNTLGDHARRRVIHAVGGDVLGGLHAARGADMLHEELGGGVVLVHSNSMLKSGMAFLQMPGIDATFRKEIITAFVAEYVDARQPGTRQPGETDVARFLRFTQERYHGSDDKPSVAQVDLAHLLSGPADSFTEDSRRAQQREAASHSGLLDEVGMAGALLLDPQKQNWTEESLRRLAWMAKRERSNPQELERLAALSGLHSARELGNLEYDNFKARLDDLRAAKDLIGEAMAFLLEGWGRSVLVALLPATTIGALVAAVTAFLLGMLSREAVSGEDYDLICGANLGIEGSEVTTFMIDEVIQLEARLVRWKPLQALGTLFFPRTPARAAIVTKYTQEVLKSIGSRVLEKGTSNTFEGKNFFDGLPKLVASSVFFAGLKTAGSTAIVPNTFFTELGDRVRTNFGKVLLGGPPPKAAIANALVGALWDMTFDPALAGLSGPDQLKLLAKKIGQSVYLTVGVTAAQTYKQIQDAKAGRAYYDQHAKSLAPVLEQDPAILTAYGLHCAEAKQAGTAPAAFKLWIETRPDLLTSFIKNAIEKQLGEAVAAQGATAVLAATAKPAAATDAGTAAKKVERPVEPATHADHSISTGPAKPDPKRPYSVIAMTPLTAETLEHDRRWQVQPQASAMGRPSVSKSGEIGPAREKPSGPIRDQLRNLPPPAKVAIDPDYLHQSYVANPVQQPALPRNFAGSTDDFLRRTGVKVQPGALAIHVMSIDTRHLRSIGVTAELAGKWLAYTAEERDRAFNVRAARIGNDGAAFLRQQLQKMADEADAPPKVQGLSPYLPAAGQHAGAGAAQPAQAQPLATAGNVTTEQGPTPPSTTPGNVTMEQTPASAPVTGHVITVVPARPPTLATAGNVTAEQAPSPVTTTMQASPQAQQAPAPVSGRYDGGVDFQAQVVMWAQIRQRLEDEDRVRGTR